MTLNSINKIKQKLEKEYEGNLEKINELNEKIRIINSNDFETKATSVMGFSLLPWLASILVFPTIIKSGVIPMNLVQPLFVGVPTLIGVTAEELFTKKAKCRERLRKFSKSRTQKEKIEEAIRYEIEGEKLINLNKILKKCHDDLSAKENMIRSLSKSCNIIEKDVDSKTTDEITTNIESLNDILVNQQQDINIATTKCVLKRKFLKIRNKINIFFDMFTFGMMGGMLCMLLYDMPIIMVNMGQFQNIQFQTSFIGMLSPFIIGGLACSGYYFKRKKTYTAIFNKLNKELGDNAISQFRDYEKDKQFDKDLENLITNASEIRLEVENKKQQLENIELQKEMQNEENPYEAKEKEIIDLYAKQIGISEEEAELIYRHSKLKNIIRDKKSTLYLESPYFILERYSKYMIPVNKNIHDEDLQCPRMTQETIDFIKSHPRLYRNCPVRVYMGKITDGEFEKRSDEVLSRELPRGEKPSTRKRSLFPNKK